MLTKFFDDFSLSDKEFTLFKISAGARIILNGFLRKASEGIVDPEVLETLSVVWAGVLRGGRVGLEVFHRVLHIVSTRFSEFCTLCLGVFHKFSTGFLTAFGVRKSGVTSGRIRASSDLRSVPTIFHRFTQGVFLDKLAEQNRGITTITAELNKITRGVERLLSETEQFGGFFPGDLVVHGDIITYFTYIKKKLRWTQGVEKNSF